MWVRDYTEDIPYGTNKQSNDKASVCSKGSKIEINLDITYIMFSPLRLNFSLAIFYLLAF